MKRLIAIVAFTVLAVQAGLAAVDSVTPAIQQHHMRVAEAGR